MLLANMSVARYISDVLPDRSMLRYVLCCGTSCAAVRGARQYRLYSTFVLGGWVVAAAQSSAAAPHSTAVWLGGSA